MESSEGFLPMSPFSYLPESKPITESRGSSNFLEGTNHHHRCSSEGFLIEEQPSWLDDLLNDSETVFHRGHRRSASDSYAYLGEESEFVNAYFGASAISQDLMHDIKGNSLAQTKYQEADGVSTLAAENGTQESCMQNLEGSDKGVGSQVKNLGTKAESRRSKQHNTHRSRVRKLQYTSHLERTLAVLKVNISEKKVNLATNTILQDQAQGNEVTAELEFVEQQNIILTMENRALRQRLESLTQEQLIKNWEQGMLEREIGRLQSLFHLQKQQQMQMQHHQQLHNQHYKHRRNRSLDHQLNNTSIKNKDAMSTKDSSVDGPIPV